MCDTRIYLTLFHLNTKRWHPQKKQPPELWDSAFIICCSFHSLVHSKQQKIFTDPSENRHRHCCRANKYWTNLQSHSFGFCPCFAGLNWVELSGKRLMNMHEFVHQSERSTMWILNPDICVVAKLLSIKPQRRRQQILFYFCCLDRWQYLNWASDLDLCGLVCDIKKSHT